MSTNYWWYLFYSNSGNSIFDSILNGHESVAAEDENTKQVLWRYTQILTPYCNLHAGRSLFWGDPRDNRWWSHLICKKNSQRQNGMAVAGNVLLHRPSPTCVPLTMTRSGHIGCSGYSYSDSFLVPIRPPPKRPKTV